uniref:NADH-ubiquinone oxidoreductase chain 5 n=1 Tax=Ameiurus melas TaxID=219545 RepID=A0A0S3H7Y6_AMEME|nr:NADH dehydrogenase subunit 5 [Ameiurus melas]
MADIITTTLLHTLAIVMWRLMTTLSPTALDQKWALNYVKSAVTTAFFIKTIPLIIFLDQGTESIITTWNWMNIINFDINISFIFDQYSLIFTPIALRVTASILEFASWYMHSDPYLNGILKYLLLLLVPMDILVTANYKFQLFIPWEGVRIMSILLIAWWHGRAEADTGALEALIYNPVGDVRLFLSIGWFAMHHNSWQIARICLVSKHFDMSLPLLALMMAGTGMSGQFGVHPWLRSPMDGPTPDSALLHSSAIVVAGFFLLIALQALMHDNQTALTFCLCLGAWTTLFTATCALTQNDIKKIVAISSSSRLGLMMVTIGLNQPQLAFVLICAHAFYKPMLVLWSASFMHSANDEQDIRKMGGLHKLMPFTSSCLIMGCLAVTRKPFLTRFLSKVAIIEALNTSHLNAWALALTLIATSFTAVYSPRVIFVVVIGSPRFSTLSPNNQNQPAVFACIERRAWGSIIAGLFISSKFLPSKAPLMTMPLSLKIAAIAVSILGIIIALTLGTTTSKQIYVTSLLTPHNFSNMLGFFPSIIHPCLDKLILALAKQGTNRDRLCMDIGPKRLHPLQFTLSSRFDNINVNFVKAYLTFYLFSTPLICVVLSTI